MTKEEVYCILSEPDLYESEENSFPYIQTTKESTKWYNRKGNSSITILFENGKVKQISSDNLFKENEDIINNSIITDKGKYIDFLNKYEQ